MKCVLGIDTSNYTTSVALVDVYNGEVVLSLKKLLPVKEGERGIRQSDAVFHHTIALPELISQAFENCKCTLAAVAVSEKPCSEEGSYMPCFLAGVSVAKSIAASLAVPLYKTTHQKGHILACLYSSGSLETIKEDFICYHVSGGTTQALLVKPDENIISPKVIAGSLDLKAGQAIDRIGLKLGFSFPAGKYVDKLACESDKTFNKASSFKGNDFSLSGLENLALKMIAESQSKEDTSKFVIDYIANTLEKSALMLKEEYGDLPLFFAGGVMSNSIINKRLSSNLNAYFCAPDYSSDNAAGVAIYGYLKWKV